MKHNTALGTPCSVDPLRARVAHEVVDNGSAVSVELSKDVNVANRLFAPAQTPRDRHTAHASGSADMIENRRDQLLDLVDLEAPCVLPMVVDGPNDLVGTLRAEAF